MRGVAQRRAGACWLLGFRGAEPGVEFLRLLERFAPPAAILFRDNLPEGPASLPALRQRLEAAAQRELLFFLDEEGGWVQQLHREPWPAPRAQAMAGLEAVRACHQALAASCRSQGIGVLIAPVADLDAGEQNPVIGTRSFGGDPEAAGAAVAAALAGLAAGGVHGVIKHYPGHGDSREDSHFSLPTVPADRGLALAPFAAGIRAGAPALMSAHLQLAGDADPRPTTFRPDVMRDRLQGELGFRGLVVTDALEMAGAAVVPPAERARAALAAGCHLLTLARWEPGAEFVLEAMAADLERGALRERWLEEAAERWERFRASLPPAGAPPAPPPDLARIGRAAIFVPGGGNWRPLLPGLAVDLEFGPLGFWNPALYERALAEAGLRARRLGAEDGLEAEVYVHLGRKAPPPARLAELAARETAPALLTNGPWGWTLPFPRRLATAESSPAGFAPLLAAAGLAGDERARDRG
ncbi:glycoside hydrolase family 3 protein [bacterium]|nr:glycoside hydrolase family 3 protein [bacterium]